MIVSKNIGLSKLISWSWHHIVWLFCYVGAVSALYYYGLIKVDIPWLPLSVIGTAVAFYVGFKNSQAYDRMWEARKIWGGIVNDSRTWGMMVDGFVTNQFATGRKLAPGELQMIKQRLIYRHIAWLYVHRNQLLAPTPWEHISQGGHLARTAAYYQNSFGVGLVGDQSAEIHLENMLPGDEYEQISKTANPATQIINAQSQDLSKLREQEVIDDFRHMEMMGLLRSFYEFQGKNERIKKFPLPRQYANMSRYFVGIFIFLLPFSMIPELMKIDAWTLWLAIPITVLIGWIYVMMEVVGDYTENPFQGMANDIPMLSICRTIEIDMRQMLKESQIPAPIQAKKNILM